MATTLKHLGLIAPPAGAEILADWPWWGVALVLVVSCGPAWAERWLDVWDRLRGRGPSP